MKRYWLCFDLGLHGSYDALYEWLDQQEAGECGDSVATFRSERSREQITKELKNLLRGAKNARVYLITLKEAIRFHLEPYYWAMEIEQRI